MSTISSLPVQSYQVNQEAGKATLEARKVEHPEILGFVDRMIQRLPVI